MAQVEGTGTVSVDPKKWWVVALLGAISIIAGILALAYPDITLLVLGLIVGINLVLIGAVWVALATMEDHTPGGRVLRFFVGFLATLPASSASSGRARACSHSCWPSPSVHHLVHHHRDGRPGPGSRRA